MYRFCSFFHSVAGLEHLKDTETIKRGDVGQANIFLDIPFLFQNTKTILELSLLFVLSISPS